MNINIGTKVECNNTRKAGHVKAIIVNPITGDMTHVVVKHKAKERIVPADHIIHADDEHVILNYSLEHLLQQPSFIATEYVRSHPDYSEHSLYSQPWVTAHEYPEMYEVQHELVPPHEVAIKRGMPVFALVGKIGHVDALVVDPAHRFHVTHFIVDSGQLWKHKEVAIALDAVEEVDEDGVFLNLTRQEVGKLPSLPVRRRFHLPQRKTSS